MTSALRTFARLTTTGFAAFTLAASILPARAEEPVLKLKDQDVWVMAGDSITAQRLHTNYIEAFFRTRYPQLHLHFRNSGIGGNRTGNILKRFDYDVAAWKPTIVSIELGMNDVNGPVEAYIGGSQELVGKIRALPAQPILISSSPVNDASKMNAWKSPRCEKIHPFTEALAKLAQDEKVPFVDQYHPLIDLWGDNRLKGAEAAAKKAPVPPPAAPVAPVAPQTPPANGAAAAPATPPAPPKAPPIPESLIPLGGDAVHPGPVGQYTMAATILKGLKADGDVSSATLSADGKLVEAKRCAITDLVLKDGKLSFTRLDEAGPWPILPAARTAVQVLPETLDLSRYMLRITGLADGDYRVTINDQPAAKVSAKDLAAGWNMTTVFDGALGERSTAILNLIAKLQGGLNNTWRAASQAKDATKLAAAQADIDTTEAELQKLVQPVPLRFTIEK